MMFSKTIVRWVVKVSAGFICIPLAGYAQNPTDLNAALEVRARDFARQVSTGQPAELTELVREDFGGNLPNIPIPAHIGMLMSYWDQSRGLTLVRLEPRTETQALGIYRNALTGGLTGIFVGVEATAPYRINAIWPLDAIHNPLLEKPKSETRASPLTDHEIARDLRKFVQRLARADVFSGVVALSHNGKVVFRGAYGESNKDAQIHNSLETPFNIASMGKMFTAVAIAQLVEANKLSYDDPLSNVLPNFPNAEAAKAIRIKHLLSHTAGLPMGEARRTGAVRESVEDILAMYSDTTSLLFEPGTNYRYSNIGYVLLGKVIEKISGEPYYSYITKHILEPAQMGETKLESLDHQSRRAIGYAKTFDAEGHPAFDSNQSQDVPRASPAGGAYSTVSDMLKFDLALRRGKLLPIETVRVLMSAKPELGATKYGYGFDVNDELDLAGHGGGLKGISNNIDFFRQSGWTAVVLSNYTSSSYEVCEPVVSKIRELVRTGD